MSTAANSTAFRKKISRRALIGSGVVAAGAGAAALILRSGNDETLASGFNLGSPGSSETLEQLRERYHGKHLRDLPGQKSGPKSGGVYHDWGFAPASWDLTGLSASLLAAYAFIFNSLISFQVGDFAENPNLWKTEPCLCDRWEWAGPTSLVMHLHPGVKWQNLPPVNGREFTAEDVVYTVNAYRTAPAQASIYRDLERIEAVDKSTVRMTFRNPAAYFERAQTQPVNLMFAREQAESADGLGKTPIGTGAFTFEDGKDRIGFAIVKNRDYWRKDPRTGMQLPYLDRVEFNFFADPQSILAAFRSKQLDSYWPSTKTNWEDVLKTNPDVVSQLTPPPANFMPHFEFRLDRAPWNDVRVRRALSMAINRPAMIEGAASGLADHGYGLDETAFDQEWPWRADQLGDFVNFDVKTAKDLMAAAGFANGLGRKAKLLLATDLAAINEDLYTIAVDSWRRNLGMETEVRKPADMAVWQAEYFTGTFEEIIGLGLVAQGADADAFTYEPLHSKSLRNYSHVNDATLDDLTERQGREMNVSSRRDLLNRIKDRDLDQAYRTWLIAPYKINVRQPYVFNATDIRLAWNHPGWASKAREIVWIDKK